MRTALAVPMLAAFVSVASAADLFTGTWKQVPAKSSNSWGEKIAQSRTRTYIPTPNGGYDVKVEAINAEGQAMSNTLQAAGDVDMSTGSSTANVVKLMGVTHVRSRRIDERKLVATYSKNGKAVGTSTSTISNDGRTLTMDLEGTATDGNKLIAKNVYEKQ